MKLDKYWVGRREVKKERGRKKSFLRKLKNELRNGKRLSFFRERERSGVRDVVRARREKRLDEGENI